MNSLTKGLIAIVLMVASIWLQWLGPLGWVLLALLYFDNRIDRRFEGQHTIPYDIFEQVRDHLYKIQRRKNPGALTLNFLKQKQVFKLIINPKVKR